jgi:hypothetical protein
MADEADVTEKYFYFSDGARRFGPYTREQVLNFIYSNRVGIMDLVFDSRSQEWCKLVNHVDFDMTETAKSEFVVGLAPGAKVAEAEIIPGLVVTLKPKTQGPPMVGQPPPIPAAAPVAPPAPKPVEATESMPVVGGLTSGLPQSPTETKSWFMKEGAITLGPYHYMTILALIQDGTLRETDLLKQKGEKDWKKVEDVFTKSEREQVGTEFFSSMMTSFNMLCRA